MDPLHICILLGPLSAYLLLIGTMNLSARPFLTTGGRDVAALALAISGFVMTGPMELFMPESAAMHFGGFTWVLLLAFYGLCVVLAVLFQRPRLVIYNAPLEQMRPILADVVAELDKEARWAGESLVLPRLGIELHVEQMPAMRNVQLVSSGPRQNFGGWRRLEVALADALRKVRGTPNPYGASLVFFGLVAVALITVCVLRDSHAVAQALREMLRQ